MIVRKLIVLVGKGVITVKAIVGSSTLFLSVVLALMVCTGGVGYGADLNIDWTKQYARMGLPMLGHHTAGGTTAYCTGAATCTATNPGNCDLLCEDYEGSSDCSSLEGDNVCRNTYSGSLGTSATIDFTSTASGTYPCSQTSNTNVLKITHSSTATNTYIYKDYGSDKPITYLQVYVRFNSLSIASGAYSNIVSGCASSNCSVALWSLSVQNTAKIYKFVWGAYNSTFAWQTITGPTITANVWYRVQIKVDKTNGKLQLIVDGTSYADLDITYASRDNRYLLVGLSTYSDTVASTEVEYDNIAVSTSGAQGACLN